MKGGSSKRSPNTISESSTTEIVNFESHHQTTTTTSYRKVVVHKDQEPLLHVDVNLGTSTNPINERIALYADSNTEEVAYQFARKNNLDEVVRQNLANLLREQLEKTLPGVEEEEEEEMMVHH